MGNCSVPVVPEERRPVEEIRRRAAQLAAAPFLRTAFDCVGEFVVIVDENRQIVFANKALNGNAAEGVSALIGCRPGEALGCIHAVSDEAPDGCGTTSYCATCGAVQAVLDSRRNGSATYDCSITLAEKGEAVNLRVRASQIDFQGRQYTVCALEDISAATRRRELESVFFHDILNMASAVRGLADVYDATPASRQPEVVRDLGHGTQRLVEEIVNFRMMTAAEENELQAVLQETSSRAFLRDVAALMEGHACGRGRSVVLADDLDDVRFVTDQNLLTHVLVNMIKNALEATPTGGRVDVNCRRSGGTIAFSVQNASAIRDDIATQVFRRSFSTKGPGRGLGTYSMKLFTEKYLDGRVSFRTSERDGTTFTAEYPILPRSRAVDARTAGA